MNHQIPAGMNRRHFISHLAGASAMAGSALAMGHTLQANAATLKQNSKAAILLWMGGGPATIDLWDLKPGMATGGPFRPISTNGDVQICEHLPMMAKNMDKFSIVRSMSTREADHTRGTYYMHTGFVPNPSITHPGYGSVVAHELAGTRPELEIPPFVSVGSNSLGPGFLGMSFAPFSVNPNGAIRDLKMNLTPDRLTRRMQALRMLEQGFIDQKRGSASEEHGRVLGKTLSMMNSQQMAAFKVDQEPEEVKERYGNNNFGKGCLLARRLVEAGVPFVEVNMGGWDMHQGIFDSLKDGHLPRLDQGMSALAEDLQQRGMLDDTAIIWMGDFGRTPRINGDAGRDHWARSWSSVVGGAGIKPGIAVGKTNEDGTRVDGMTQSSENLMATVCHALGISLKTTFASASGRPMKIANSGKVIAELFA